ncbi:hypothetical protein [Oricola cellulosilytica]|uniref:Porin family protein n=1 Tax=Oricola cellulosilytica TaxID=1429082 RepID=A0A4R0PFP9_9HYPH|nr:hypothetical protein [Oricola cellulosilytica]TCD15429.1 hypothetical protein E0D97_07830 [Oricola cellulosilytica]
MTNAIIRMIRAAIAALCLTGTNAAIADTDKPAFADHTTSARPAELGSGWYIRGDLGLHLGSEHDVGMSGSRSFGLLSSFSAERLTHRMDAASRSNGLQQSRTAPDGLRKRIVASRN